MGTDLREIIVQPGSFNPLHEGHLAIYRASIKHYWAPHRFILASITCDKGIIPLPVLHARSEAIRAQGGHFRIVESGLFVDIVKIFEQEGYERIILAVGEDTLYRFWRDWDRHYSDNYPDEYLKRYVDYKTKFQNVTWYVAQRNCPELNMYRDLSTTYFDYHDNIEWSKLPLNDISSTKIRNGEVQNSL